LSITGGKDHEAIQGEQSYAEYLRIGAPFFDIYYLNLSIYWEDFFITFI